MMKETLIVEPLPAHGHVKLNSFFIESLKENHNIRLVINDKVSDKYKRNIPKYNELILDDITVSKVGSFRLNNFIFHIRLLKLILARRPNNILLLSYYPVNILWFSVVLYFFNIDFFVFEHNTVPNDKSSLFKRLLFRSIPKNVKHICFMSYISKHLKDEYNKDSYTVFHPMLCDSRSNEKFEVSRFYFCPSKSIDRKKIEKLSDVICKLDPSAYLMCKHDIKKSNIIYQPYFDNYYELMRQSIAVINPIDFQYRVSGVAYEALALNKTLLCVECLFTSNLKEYFPDNIVYFDDLTSIEVLGEDEKKYINIESYNKHTIEQLNYSLGTIQ